MLFMFFSTKNREICNVLYSYLQVVTLAVYFYFLASLFGAQWVMPATEEVGSTVGTTNFVMSTFGKANFFLG
jgi:hypothetical protein